MRLHLVSTALGFMLLVSAPAHGQYMYLDANGNGIHDGGDVLGSGTTTVAIWFDSNHDRDGNARTCNEHTGHPSTSSQLGVFSYSIFLHAREGTVSYGNFEADSPSVYSSPVPDIGNDTDIRIGRTRSSGVAGTGASKLGTLAISVTSGSPDVTIVTLSDVDPGMVTEVGTVCDGSEFPNSYVLGLDWFDVDGLASSQIESPADEPVVSATGGTLYMGGNLIAPPYRMTFVEGRLTVNGWKFPSAQRTPVGWRPTASDTANDRLVVESCALKNKLYSLGIPQEEVLARVNAFLGSSSIVSSSKIDGMSVKVAFASGGTVRIPITAPLASRAPTATKPIPTAEGHYSQLQGLRRTLESGGVIFLIGQSFSYSMVGTSASDALSAVGALQRGEVLGPDQGKLLSSDIRVQLLEPVTLEQVK